MSCSPLCDSDCFVRWLRIDDLWVVRNVIAPMDFGLAMLLLLLAIVLGWRLIDLFKPKGRWTDEVGHELSEEVMK